MSRVQVNARQAPQRCPLCHQSVSGRSCACPVCATRYHVECTRELGRTCAVLGCEDRLAPEPERVEFLGARDSRFGGRAAPPPPAGDVDELRGVVARAWDSFSVLHFGCGVLFFVPLVALLAIRLLPRLSGLTFKTAAVSALVLAFVAGWKQDAFWQGLFHLADWRRRRL